MSSGVILPFFLSCSYFSVTSISNFLYTCVQYPRMIDCICSASSSVPSSNVLSSCSRALILFHASFPYFSIISVNFVKNGDCCTCSICLNCMCGAKCFAAYKQLMSFSRLMRLETRGRYLKIMVKKLI